MGPTPSCLVYGSPIRSALVCLMPALCLPPEGTQLLLSPGFLPRFLCHLKAWVLSRPDGVVPLTDLYSLPSRLRAPSPPQGPTLLQKAGGWGWAGESSLAGPVFSSREHRQKAALSSVGLLAKWTTLSPGISAGLSGLGRSRLCPTVLEKSGLQKGC